MTDSFRQALALHQQGRLADAENLYRAVLASEPSHFDALHLLGVVQHQFGRHAEALALIGRAIAINSNVATPHSNLGLVLQDLRRFEEALARYDLALQLKPDFVEAHFNRGNVLRDLHRPAEALPSYDRALQFRPDYAEAWNNRGNALTDLGRTEEALVCFDRALALNPGYAEVYYNRGNALRSLNRPAEALECYDRALQLRPDFAEALSNCGNALRDLGRLDEALEANSRALRLRPNDAGMLCNYGTTLLDLHRPEEALAALDRALSMKPDFAQALNNRASALRELNRFDEALAGYARASQARPDYAEALSNCGTVLMDLKRPQDALAYIDRALQIKPDLADAWNNRGSALFDLKRYAEAAQSHAHVLTLAPHYESALGSMFHAQLYACDWTGFDETKARVLAGIERNERQDTPFPFLIHSESPAAQRACARLYVEDLFPSPPAPVWTGERYRHGKIRIAYLSADFHDHATAYLMAELFELHDRARFEIEGVSFGLSAGKMHDRVRHSFDAFHDVRAKSDRETALLLREREIDIAVDLKGFTTDSRPGIVMHRGAGLQVSYLGYPGTMGTDCVDYILADAQTIPSSYERFYSEKVVRLPGSYQVNDRKRRVAERTPNRAELGLPEDGLVFCCFNNNYKIAPAVFDIWMRLLQRVEGSVLWLLGDNADSMRNLRREAETRGVPGNRIVFASRLDLLEHLARHRQANLFLDTYPCNAHTTASDALWAGLPLVTCMGETFASRVAGSLLHAAGLPELATHSLAEYESLAFKLASEPDTLAEIRARLAHNRERSPLFDTKRFRRHIEAAYIRMYERHMRGDPPASFDVLPSEK